MGNPSRHKPLRGGYTLVELLVTTLIITLLASVALVGIAGAREIARENRTRAQIAYLKELLNPMYDAYLTRAIPVRLPFNAAGNQIPAARLRLVRELMRMEMPDRVTDVQDGPTTTFQVGTINRSTGAATAPQTLPPLSSALFRSHQRRATAGWTPEFQGSECLYLIVSSIRDGDQNGLDFFLDKEIADTDGDGMPEILDAWGNPIEFLRWAPGHRSVVQKGDSVPLAERDPDPFDPFKIDPRAKTADPTFALTPLIVSGGKSEEIGLILDTSPSSPHHYKPPSADGEPNDPYGTNFGANDGVSTSQGDNITSHNVNAG